MEQIAKLKKTWNLALVLQIVEKIPEKYCLYLYLSIGQVSWLNELCFKIYIQKCTTDLRNCGMVKNIKTWISWERNISFLRNKKFINLCLSWHILISYRSIAEVTFNRFLFFVVLSSINFLLNFSFSQAYKVLVCLVITIFMFYVSFFSISCLYSQKNYLKYVASSHWEVCENNYRLKLQTIIAKSSILNVWQGSEYTYAIGWSCY